MKSKKLIHYCPAIIALSFGLLCPSSLYAFTEVYNTAGTFDWVCPDGVTSITVECWGGGGAGGSAYRFSGATGSNHAGGGGGGGGAYSKGNAIAVTPGLTYTVTIPAAATNPVVQGNPIIVDGTDVSFTGDSATVTAVGGKGGESIETTTDIPLAGAGGLGGDSVDCIGDTVFSGGLGAQRLTQAAGAGGGGAGNANVGGDALSVAPWTAGAGGADGGGTGGNSVSGNRDGYPGANSGGGGGGGRSQTAGAGKNGGPGGLGQIILTDGAVFTSVKADNSDDLNLASSWTAGLPGGSDVAVWDATVSAANTTAFLGADLTWGGIAIQNPADLVTIEAGNTLTLGLADTDIDLSAATVDLTVNAGLAMSAANVWDIQTGRTLTLAGPISGNNSFTKQGAGKVILSGANFFNATGTGVTIAAGTLQLGANEVIPQGAGKGNVTVNGTLDLNGFTEVINGLDGTGIVDTTAVDGISTLSIGFGVSNSNFSGIIQNTAGTLNLVKVQSNTAQLSNANTFSGTARVEGGTLKLNDPLALQNVTGISVLTANLSLPADTTTLAAPVSLEGVAKIISPAAGGQIATLAGGVSGFGSLTKDAFGDLILAGPLTYSGDTLVSAGLLSLGSANPNNDASTITITQFSGQLKLDFAGTDVVGGLFAEGVRQPAGVYGHTDSGADNGGQGVGFFDFSFAPGTGTLTVVASGYQNWASGFAGLTDTNPSVDFDLGSLDTGVEFVVGGDPTIGSDDVSLAPTSSVVGTSLVFEYRRTPLANEDPNATISVEYGSDLVGWTKAVDGDPGVSIVVNPGFYVADDQVVVTLANTLANGGKIFARLNVVIATP